MLENKKILQSQEDDILRNELIEEYDNFILRCASKATGRFVDKSDDIHSIAMIAFNDAIGSYDDSKGNFDAFAAKTIHNRVIDYLRSENRHENVIPISTLSKFNDHGDEVAFDIEDKKAGISDTALEIYSLKTELEKFEISFFDIPAYSPKSKKTISACISAAEYIVMDKQLLKDVYEKKTLPVKNLVSDLGVGKKIPERYRKYIIMTILILNGDYEILRDNLLNGKKVCG